MLSYIAGIVIFLLILVAKQSLARVLLLKKQVAFSVITIVISESLMLFLIYNSVGKYGLESIKIMLGFLLSMVITVAIYSYKFMAKQSETKEDGKF